MYFRIAEGIKKPGEVTESRQRDWVPSRPSDRAPGL